MIYYDNKYVFRKELGSGGFGRVFLAKDIVSGRLVAIKELRNSSQKAQRDIVHEIIAISKFQHPNIVTYYHHFWSNEILYLVMEYCPGGSLKNKIVNEDYSADTVFNWFATLTTTLRVIHAKGLTHHDIKPDNILFTHDGEIKIADFGVANKDIGTLSYLYPEFFSNANYKNNRIQADIYALGVTLMETLRRKNIFRGKNKNEILEIHNKAEYQIDSLPHWQQEIILRAINKTPELRFHFMVQFEEAIKAKAVPHLFRPATLKAAEIVELAKKEMRSKKWLKAINYLDLAEKRFPDQVFIYQEKAKYYLRINQLSLAKSNIEKALRLNPRLNLQKDLGWINLGNKNYPLAISLLSDHLHRNPTDYEAYNMLAQCYYETNRFETCGDLSKMLHEITQLPCFLNNYYLCNILQKRNSTFQPKINHPILEYNLEVVNEVNKTCTAKNLKSKLLFMDFRFNKFKKNRIMIEVDDSIKDFENITTKAIVKIGRSGYSTNDIQLDKRSGVSRRHCIIINSKDDCWLYDLSLTGCKVNEVPVKVKTSLLGFNEITISGSKIKINTDINKLL